MKDPEELLDRVRQHGIRITRQRDVILQVLCELEGHACAEEVCNRVSRHQRDVDLSTVYRTLERLHELNIVSQTDLGHGCTEYEIVGRQPHHHLVCQHCGQIIELDDDYLAPMAESIHRDFDFALASSHFALFGTCQACREQKRPVAADRTRLQSRESAGLTSVRMRP